MKIRTITIGIRLSVTDLVAAVQRDSQDLESLIASIWEKGQQIQQRLEQEYRYTVQTRRLTFNSFEEWLIPCIEVHGLTLEMVILFLDKLLRKYEIGFCSVGCNTNLQYSHYIPKIMALSSVMSCSINFSNPTDLVSPDYEDCVTAAQVCRQIAHELGDLGNFRFCVGFGCPANTPFYPISYHHGSSSNDPHISLGLENGDLIFLAGFAAKTLSEARDQLVQIIKQSILPIQTIVSEECQRLQLHYQGIDASMNPGLLPQDSIGNGIEQLIMNIMTTEKDNTLLQQNPLPVDNLVLFGKQGTLAAVLAITAALKQLEKDPELILTGYSGLMLPVMEDLVLATRAATNPPLYGLRDLLVFSAACGVGLDTIPIPGETTPEEIARIYLEVGTLAFRLKKPLSCRLLPMRGKKSGDETVVDSPYLCNTRVFSCK